MGAPPPGGMGPPGGGMGAPPPGAPMAAPPSGGGGSSVAKYIGIGCGVLILLSCLAWGGCYACSMIAANSIPQTPVVDPGVGGGGVAPAPVIGGGGGGSTCARAVECCNAYAATPLGASVASSCPTYNTAGMPDSACQSAIDGFRTGFTATGQAVPAACQ